MEVEDEDVVLTEDSVAVEPEMNDSVSSVVMVHSQHVVGIGLEASDDYKCVSLSFVSTTPVLGTLLLLQVTGRFLDIAGVLLP